MPDFWTATGLESLTLRRKEGDSACFSLVPTYLFLVFMNRFAYLSDCQPINEDVAEWAQGEPNNWSGIEDGVMSFVQGEEWNDVSVDSYSQVVCEVAYDQSLSPLTTTLCVNLNQTNHETTTEGKHISYYTFLLCTFIWFTIAVQIVYEEGYICNEHVGCIEEHFCFYSGLPDPEHCYQSCLESPECKFWTMSMVYGDCYLKSANDCILPSSDWIWGVKPEE